jgi:hypothetical protein
MYLCGFGHSFAKKLDLEVSLRGMKLSFSFASAAVDCMELDKPIRKNSQ